MLTTPASARPCYRSCARGGAVLSVILAVLLLGSANATAVGAGKPRPGGPTTVATIVAGLRSSHVYVAPDATARVSAAQRQQLEHDGETSPDPLYVVVLGALPSGENATYDVARSVARGLGGAAEAHGWVVVYADDTLPAIGGTYSTDDHEEDYLDAMGRVDQDQGTVAQRLLALTGRLSGRLPNAGAFGDPAADPSYSGFHRRPASGRVRAAQYVAIAVAILLGLGVIAALLRLVLRSGGSRLRTRRFSRRVARGGLADLTIRARRAVLDLGGRLEAVEPAAGDDRDLWQAALDAYERAGRRLDAARTDDDYRQVLALCDQSARDLTRARGGARRG